MAKKRAKTRAKRKVGPQTKAVNQAAFLAAFRGFVQPACDAAGIARSTYDYWMNTDKSFPQKKDEAMRMAIERWEEIAINRGTIGLPRKKFYKDKPVIDPKTGQQYVEDEPSDTLLMFMLNGNAPEKYRRQDINVNASHSGQIVIVELPAKEP